jgi:hypothetical protein
MIGRWCEINNEKEVQNLQYGMDFRHPKYRREVFIRFYEFHLKYKAHPGAVYYIFPFLFEHENMTTEQKLWFTFINGCSQNVVTTWMIWKRFPNMQETNVHEISSYFRKHYAKFGWDVDRRYVKNQFEDALQSYYKIIGTRTQEEYFNAFLKQSPYENFDLLWDEVISKFHLFGRLATFSYLEYLRIAGLNIDCSQLFFYDITGSKSHRNGMCKVLGRDDLDWHLKNDVQYSLEVISWITKEAEILLNECKQRINHPDVSYFTLESTLCCYKSWHRPNRRYPNVYNDMFYDRIKVAENNWGQSLDIFWLARKSSLPRYLLREHNHKDVGVAPLKQNHYLRTGEVIMMNQDYDCFQNKYNEWTK